MYMIPLKSDKTKSYALLPLGNRGYETKVPSHTQLVVYQRPYSCGIVHMDEPTSEKTLLTLYI